MFKVFKTDEWYAVELNGEHVAQCGYDVVDDDWIQTMLNYAYTQGRSEVDKYRVELDRIKTELNRQENKWGSNRINQPEVWLTVLVEEVGEVARGLLERDPENVLDELIQVAAVCVSAHQDILRWTAKANKGLADLPKEYWRLFNIQA